MANNILKGKRGIIFGALDSKSIAWKVAEHAHAEGAKFVLTNAPIALRMGTINELAEQTGLIGLVTAWVISRVLDDQARLKRDGIAMQVSINISAQDLSDDGLKFLIEQKLQQNNLEAHTIIKWIDKGMREKIQSNAEDLNYLPKSSSLF